MDWTVLASHGGTFMAGVLMGAMLMALVAAGGRKG